VAVAPGVVIPDSRFNSRVEDILLPPQTVRSMIVLTPGGW
jgi:hypothetical protein